MDKCKCCRSENSHCNQDEYYSELTRQVCATFADRRAINLFEDFSLPRQQEILELIEHLLEVVFPGYRLPTDYGNGNLTNSIGKLLRVIGEELEKLIFSALCFQNHLQNCPGCKGRQEVLNSARNVLDSIAPIREMMKHDLKAAYEGDPAAMNEDEVVFSYPGIKAITIQRFAHVLYLEKVPLLPRMLTEYAHSITGIDIHPGAELGCGIFIDHGTGVVIGETAKIGNNVKIYQGVTLGALSFPKDACGMIIKGNKRHPTIEDNVTIYAGATVLGDVVIGKNSVLGGNVWVTSDLPPGSKVVISQ